MIKMIQKNMNKKGFTLVELIIVIAVMAILAAIVIPRMAGITTSFKQKADKQVCENYARDLELQVQMGLITVAATGQVTAALLNDATLVIATPESLADAAYYYSYDLTNKKVIVGVIATASAPTTYALVAAAAVDATRDNATPID